MNNDTKRTPPAHASSAPVTVNLNIRTAGPRGPALSQDVWPIEKLTHFARQVIPESRIHAKGSGAHGNITVTHDVKRYTKGKIFSRIGKETPISTVACEFANTARQVGQAAKHIQEHNIANCAKADPTYGKGIARALGLAFGPPTMAAQ
jgi:catalase